MSQPCGTQMVIAMKETSDENAFLHFKDYLDDQSIEIGRCQCHSQATLWTRSLMAKTQSEHIQSSIYTTTGRRRMHKSFAAAFMDVSNLSSNGVNHDKKENKGALPEERVFPGL